MDPLTPIDVVPADVAEEDVAALLSRHFDLMRSQSPPESCHVLPGAALAAADVSVWVARQGDVALGVGALRHCGSWGEVKSMHTAAEARGKGVALALLEAVTAHARASGITRLNLETGSGDEHAPARRLYTRAGFEECAPFGDYVHDPLSVFMTRTL
jgi:putative acetyltransferase